MNITEIAIKRKVVTYTIFLILIISGISAYFGMEKAEDPGFEIKTATITTIWPGATTAQMDELVSGEIEKILQDIEELDWIESKNRPGLATVYINLVPTLDRPLQDVWDELRRKIGDNAPQVLPKGVIGPLVNDQFGDVFGTLISVTGKDYSYKQLYDIADDMRDELLKIEHVGKIKIFGKQKEHIFVDFNNAKLAAMKVSPTSLIKIVQTTNIVAPGGDVLEGDDRLILETTGDFKSVEDIKNTVIKIPGQEGNVYLKDIATITRGYVEPASYIARYNGEKSVVLGLTLKSGKNNILLGEEANTMMNEFRVKYPIGVNFDFLAYQPGIVSDKINSFVSNLGQAIVTIIAVMVFALGLRTGFIVSSLIPIVACVTFLVLKSLNMGLDQMSLAGLIIALGMLVDNSIVMSESIMVMMEQGKSRMDACLDSANELRGPLLVASLIIVASFSPIFLAEESIGEYTAPIGIVVAICLLSSWMIANTLIPLLCHDFLQVEQQEADYSGKWYSLYKGILVKLLKFKKMTAIAAAGVFILGVFLFKFIPVQFMPGSDKPIMFSEIRLPVGTAIETTEAVIKDLDNYIAENFQVPNEQVKVGILKTVASGGTAREYKEPGILTWGAFIGGGAPRYFLPYSPEAPAPEYAYVVYNLTDHKLIPEFSDEVDSYIKSKFPNVDVITRSLSTGPSASKDVQYRIRGKNLEELYERVEIIKEKLRTVPGAINISDNWNIKTKKVTVNINQERVKRSGLTNAEVAGSLKGILSGVAVTDYREGDDIIPVIFRTESDFRNRIERLDTTVVYSNDGQISVPLRQIADIEIAFEPGFIYRWDREYTIIAQSDVQDGYTANEINRVMIPWLDEKMDEWGNNYILGGEAEQGDKAGTAVKDKLPIAGMLVILLLIVQFNSIKKPIVILLTIPLGILGTAVGLMLNGMNFGFMPLIGIISLCGVVINAAIVLIDRIDLEIAKGLTPQQAVVTACLARIRPILLTTLTTVCGLVPLWLFGGTLFSPMAVALLFGLIFATALTLGVIPALYSIFFKTDFKNFED